METQFDESVAMRKKLDAIGWGAFFVWMGVVLLIKSIPQGVASIGIAAIILGETVARLIFKVSVSAFWILLGVIFLASGIGELTAINMPLLPIIFILAGSLIIFRQVTKDKKTA